MEFFPGPVYEIPQLTALKRLQASRLAPSNAARLLVTIIFRPTPSNDQRWSVFAYHAIQLVRHTHRIEHFGRSCGHGNEFKDKARMIDRMLRYGS